MDIVTDRLELKKVCEKVKIFEVSRVVALFPHITKIMTINDGVGIAANQVGINKTFFLAEIGSRVKLFINPKITYFSEETEIDKEGCLSYPGIFKSIARSKDITIQYFDYKTKKMVKENYSGFTARVIQHEYDHLIGKCKVGEN